MVDEDEAIICFLAAVVARKIQILQEGEFGEDGHQLAQVSEAVTAEVQSLKEFEALERPFEGADLVVVRIQLTNAEVAVQAADVLERIVVHPQRFEVHKRLKASQLLDTPSRQVQLRAICMQGVCLAASA